MIELYGVTFHIVELALIPFLLFYLPALVFEKRGSRIRACPMLRLYLAGMSLFLFSIALSSLAAWDRSAVWKSFFKWVEIIGLTLAVFLYCSSLARFIRVWRLLLLVYAVSIAYFLVLSYRLALAGSTHDALRSLPAYTSLFVVALIVPFPWHSTWKLAGVVMLCGLVLISLTRGAWIALFVLGAYLLWQGRMRVKAFALGASLALVFLIVVEGNFIPEVREPVYERAQTAFDPQVAGTLVRLEILTLAAHAFWENPLTGIGADNFPLYFIRSSERRAFNLIREPDKISPHNFFIQCAAENGILGILGAGAWLFALYKIAFRRSGASPLPPYLSGLQLHFAVLAVALTFGYVSGELRLPLALYIGLVLGSLRIYPVVGVSEGQAGLLCRRKPLS